MVGNVLKGLFWLGPHFWKIFKGREGLTYFAFSSSALPLRDPSPSTPFPKAKRP